MAIYRHYDYSQMMMLPVSLPGQRAKAYASVFGLVNSIEKILGFGNS